MQEWGEHNELFNDHFRKTRRRTSFVSGDKGFLKIFPSIKLLEFNMKIFVEEILKIPVRRVVVPNSEAEDRYGAAVQQEVSVAFEGANLHLCSQPLPNASIAVSGHQALDSHRSTDLWCHKGWGPLV